jgi:hypothetical protein
MIDEEGKTGLTVHPRQPRQCQKRKMLRIHASSDQWNDAAPGWLTKG